MLSELKEKSYLPCLRKLTNFWAFRNANCRLRKLINCRKCRKANFQEEVVQNASTARASCCWKPKNCCVNCCFTLLFTFCRLELVPISHRLQVVTSSSDKFEELLGYWGWEDEAEEYAGKIVGPNDPLSVRVQQVLTKIIQALHDILGFQRDCHISVYAPEEANPAAASLVSSRRRRLVGSKHDSTDNGKISFQSKNWLLRKLVQSCGGTKYLDGINWEVMVIDCHEDNAWYIPMGKIVFCTGKIPHISISDATIAATMGHEVAHGVGRHASEDVLRSLGFMPSQLTSCFADSVNLEKWTEAIRMFFRRRMEFEADYIGMILMAAAGYDPKYAATLCRTYDPSVGLLSTHPSGEKRAKMLEKSKAMKAAMDIYEQFQAGPS